MFYKITFHLHTYFKTLLRFYYIFWLMRILNLKKVKRIAQYYIASTNSNLSVR